MTYKKAENYLLSRGFFITSFKSNKVEFHHNLKEISIILQGDEDEDFSNKINKIYFISYDDDIKDFYNIYTKDISILLLKAILSKDFEEFYEVFIYDTKG